MVQPPSTIKTCPTTMSDRELHKKSIALSREIDATWVLALAQFSLGDLEHIQGNLSLAETLSADALKHFEQLGDGWGMALVLSNLGNMMYSRGDFFAAKNIFLEALRLNIDLGQKDGITIALNGLAGVLCHEGEVILSARLQGLLVTIQKEIGISFSLYLVEQGIFDSTAIVLKESMGFSSFLL